MPLHIRSIRPLARRSIAPLLAVLLAASACKSAEERATTTSAAPGETTPAAADARDDAPVGTAVASPDSALRAAADLGRIAGDPSAKVWMLIVSDFECPYCKQWHDATYATLRREYVETGKVRMAYLNFPLPQHVQAVPAANAAMCAAAQGKFWQYQSALFEEQKTWAAEGDKRDRFERIGQRVGVELPALRACMQSNAMRPLIESDRDRSERAGVSSTPTFIIGNERLSGAAPIEDFRRVLDAAIAGAAK
jgi:protein-disulfide isomerase